MKFLTSTSLCLTATWLAAAAAAAAAASDFTVQILPNALLPNPDLLLASTSATLQRHGLTLHRPLSRRNTFDFSDVDEGSYLLTVHSRDFAFAPLRVDVSAADGTTGEASATGGVAAATATTVPKGETRTVRIDAWQTFWGHEWSNKGEHKAGGVGAVVVGVTAERRKEFYTQRAGFSPLSFLKSPMILMAVFTLAMAFGFPYLMNNMDDETRAEFEQLQSKSSLGSSSNTATNLQNFDFAAWMSGQGSESKQTSEGKRKT